MMYVNDVLKYASAFFVVVAISGLSMLLWVSHKNPPPLGVVLLLLNLVLLRRVDSFVMIL